MCSGRAGVESIRGGGVGGAPPPRTGCTSGNSTPLCPTLQHNCRHSSHNSSNPGSYPDTFSLQICEFLRGPNGEPPVARRAQDRVQAARSARPDCSSLDPSVASSDASRSSAHPPLPAPDRRRARRLRRRPAAPPTPTPRARCRPARRSTSRASCAPRATSATTCSTPRARCCAPTTPRRKIHELIDKGLEESDGPAMTYKDDIAPWLGEKAGVWVAGVDRKEPGLRRARRDQGHREGAGGDRRGRQGGRRQGHAALLLGVDYQVDDDGVAAGIVGDFFTVGTEAEFKRTVKAADGDSLADDKRFKSTIDELDDDRIGLFYVDLKPFIEQALKSDPAGQAAATSRSARSSRSTSSSRSPARCSPTATGSPSTR